ncbi:MAG: hypothetical protein [Olavius algarvensis Gamma 1 endosymbiont]|nr:MAG: hypothetical protein [Olavius algarvensis Gamma 1 endosymbiont]
MPVHRKIHLHMVKECPVVVIFEVIPSQQWAIIRYYIGV